VTLYLIISAYATGRRLLGCHPSLTSISHAPDYALLHPGPLGLVGTTSSIIIPAMEENALHGGPRLMRALGRLVLIGVFCAFAARSADADGSVSSLGMGNGARDKAEFAQFLAVIQQYNASGERFRIDSHCQSACTMFLSIRNVCIAPGAALLFHAGGDLRKGIINPDTTQRMLDSYNAALRDHVTANHFMDTFFFSPIPATDLIERFGYPACP
jgi:hypothetical protein